MNVYIEEFGRALHVIQALNGNRCNAYFVSGKIKELKKTPRTDLVKKGPYC